MKQNNQVSCEKSTQRPLYIELFEIAIADLKKSLSNAAKIFGEAVEKNPDARNKFEQYFPNHKEFFNKLESFYKGLIREEVFFIGGEVGEKIRRLPMAAQNEVVEKGVKMLTADGDSLIVRADTMTAFQARQVISPTGSIRNLQQQKAWIESQKIRSEIAKKSPMVSIVREKPYEIKNGILYTYGEQKFDRQKLFDILRKMI